jgi:hypothetical protein
VALFSYSLEFGDRFEIFREASSALHFDQALQPKAAALYSTNLDLDGVRKQLLTRLSSSALKLFSKLLKLHELLKTLVHREAEVLADQSYIDVFLVSLYHCIELQRRLLCLVRVVHLNRCLL